MTSNPNAEGLHVLPDTKGTSSLELATHANAKLSGDCWHFGPFRLISTERRLTRDGTYVAIGGRAFDLLVALIERAGEIVSARELHQLVWPDVVVEEANLRVCIAALRKTLGERKDCPRYVVNIVGRGYTFAAPVRRSASVGPFSLAPPLNQEADKLHWPPTRLLVSRHEAIDLLSRLLSSRNFVRVVAPDGTRRETVADWIAGALQESCGEDAACFLHLHPFQVQDTDTETLFLNIEDKKSEADAQQAVHDFLKKHQLLIVLGQTEHYYETIGTLFGQIYRSPGVHFLTTSRAALRLDAQNLPPQSHSDATLGKTLSAIEGLRLAGIAASTYQHWRQELSLLKGEGGGRLETLQKENDRLRKAITDLTIEKLSWKDAAPGNI